MPSGTLPTCRHRGVTCLGTRSFFQIRQAFQTIATYNYNERSSAAQGNGFRPRPGKNGSHRGAGWETGPAVGNRIATNLWRPSIKPGERSVQEILEMAPETFPPALQTVGNYDLVEKIADGGMGTVYKGRHRHTGEIVAVKLLAPQMSTNVTYLQRFEKEYITARSLNHPNIVRALEQGVSEGRPYLVMEYVDGESVGQRLERSGRMPQAEAIRIISLAALGLQRAHSQGL